MGAGGQSSNQSQRKTSFPMSSFLLSEELGDQRVGLIIPLVSYDRFGHQDSLELLEGFKRIRG